MFAFVRVQPAFLPCHCLSTATQNEQTTTATSIDLLVDKYQFSPQAAKLVSSRFRSRRINTENADSMLSFFKQRGFSDTQLERFFIRSPRLLSSGLKNNIQPKLMLFQEYGFSDSELVEILSNDPWMISQYGASRITACLSIYKTLLGSNERLANFLRRHKRLCYSDLNQTLLPNIEFLKSCGIEMEHITALLYSHPHCISSIKPETLLKIVHRIDEMGVERTSKVFLTALWVVSQFSNETWEFKLKTFKDFGFSEDDIARILRSSPTAFNLSEQKIKKVIEVLLETGKYDMSCIIKWPMSFTYSVEKRYMPRLQVLKILEKKNLMEKWPGLSTLVLMTDKKFYKKYACLCVDEVGETITAKSFVN